MDWWKSKTCIMCDRGGDQLLLCCESGCPVALHTKCMGSEHDIHDAGNFYCPYCWYKRSLVESIESREKAMVAKKALSHFIELEMDADNGGKKNFSEVEVEVEETNVSSGGVNSQNNSMGNHEQQSHSLQLEKDKGRKKHNAKVDESDERSTFAGRETDSLSFIQNGKAIGNKLHEDSSSKENISGSHRGKMLEKPKTTKPKGSKKVDNNPDVRVAENHKQGEHVSASCMEEEASGNRFQVLEVGVNKQAEDSIKVDDIMHEGIDEKEKEEPLNTFRKGKKRSRDDSLHASTKEKCDAMKEPEEEQDIAEEEKQKVHVFSSTDSPNEKSQRHSDCETKGVSPNMKQRIKRKAPPRNVVPVKKSPPRNVTPVKKSSARRDSYKVVNNKQDNILHKTPSKFQSPNKMDLVFPNDKRQRKIWSPEEEEVLREGVQKFSSEVKKNLPWRKILELGQHAFHETRTPTDLKDKWRQIMSRESASDSRS